MTRADLVRSATVISSDGYRHVSRIEIDRVAEEHNLDRGNKQDQRDGRSIVDEMQDFDAGHGQHTRNAVPANRDGHTPLRETSLGRRKHRILEPHCHVGDAGVVDARDATQAFFRCSVRDDAQARPLRIGCDHTRDGFDESCELARVGSREQEGVRGCAPRDLLRRTGGYNSSF